MLFANPTPPGDNLAVYDCGRRATAAKRQIRVTREYTSNFAAAEFEEAEVRGKGAVPRSFGQRDTRDERVARASAAAVAVGEGRRRSFSSANCQR